jgi:hypothetical protein
MNCFFLALAGRGARCADHHSPARVRREARLLRILVEPYHPGPKGAGPATTFTKAKLPPLQPGGEALFYEPRTGDPRHDDPRALCLPSGFPSGFFGPYPVQIVQSRDYLVMVTEFQRITRLIPLDSRAHLKDIEPTIRWGIGKATRW